jgi:hypothetical protein
MSLTAAPLAVVSLVHAQILRSGRLALPDDPVKRGCALGTIPQRAVLALAQRRGMTGIGAMRLGRSAPAATIAATA